MRPVLQLKQKYASAMGVVEGSIHLDFSGENPGLIRVPSGIVIYKTPV